MSYEKPLFHTNKYGRKLAYRMQEGDLNMPAVIFLGGFKSDMEGSKATFLENFCKSQNLSYIRFDYSGHGTSEGQFEDGSIGEWFEDAKSIIEDIAKGKETILIGSSMGGWISLLCAKAKIGSIKALILLAPAPDFTTEILDRFESEQRQELEKTGRVLIPNDYSDEPYIFTQKLIDDGQNHLLLNREIPINIPVKIIQGMQDKDVPWEKAVTIQKLLLSDNVNIELIKDAGHSLSREQDLVRLEDALRNFLS